MKTTDELTDILGSARLFGSLSEDHLQDLLERCRHRTHISGEALWAAGEPGDAAYILVEGRLETTWRVQPDGQRSRQAAHPGATLGLAYLVHDWAHESSAYPLEKSEVLELRRRDFQELFEQGHPAAFRLTDALADELVDEVRDANRRMHEVFGHPADTLRTLRRRARSSERR
jgi:CRP-like cAMP-binding protein